MLFLCPLFGAAALREIATRDQEVAESVAVAISFDHDAWNQGVWKTYEKHCSRRTGSGTASSSLRFSTKTCARADQRRSVEVLRVWSHATRGLAYALCLWLPRVYRTRAPPPRNSGPVTVPDSIRLIWGDNSPERRRSCRGASPRPEESPSATVTVTVTSSAGGDSRHLLVPTPALCARMSSARSSIKDVEPIRSTHAR